MWPALPIRPSALSPSLTTDRGHQQGRAANKAPCPEACRRGFQLLNPTGGQGGPLPCHQPQKLRLREGRQSGGLSPRGGLWKPCESGCNRSPWGGWPGHPSQLSPPPDSGCLTSAGQPHPTLGGPRCLDSRPAAQANGPLPGRHPRGPGQRPRRPSHLVCPSTTAPDTRRHPKGGKFPGEGLSPKGMEERG